MSVECHSEVVAVAVAEENEYKGVKDTDNAGEEVHVLLLSFVPTDESPMRGRFCPETGSSLTARLLLLQAVDDSATHGGVHAGRGSATSSPYPDGASELLLSLRSRPILQVSLGQRSSIHNFGISS